MTDEAEQPAPPQSREGKRALQLKSEMIGLLMEVTELLERARMEGFEMSFALGKNEKGENVFIPEVNLKVSKSW
jgi:hypothetical protein